MFFWIVTICNLLYYFLSGIISIFYGSLFSELDTLSEYAEIGTAMTVSGVLEMVLVMASVVLVIMAIRKTPNTIRFWLVTLAAIATYEIVQAVQLIGSGVELTEFVWPVIAIYFFLRGLMSAKRLRITIESTGGGEARVT